MNAYLGIELGGQKIRVARTGGFNEPPELDQRAPDFPAALVISPSTAPRLSERGPIPLAGAGLLWPTSAHAGLSTASPSGRRIPLAKIWESFLSGDGPPVEGALSLESDDAISIVLDEIIDGSGSSAGVPRPACLVVPNDLNETQQQSLIDACRRRGVEATLLWRPVAAAFGWLGLHAHELSEVVQVERSIGSLLTIHLGVDGFEAAWLELILRPITGAWLLPARRRPPSSCLRPRIGIQLLEDAARSMAFAESGERSDSGSWRGLWASPGSMQLGITAAPATELEAWGVNPSFGVELQRKLVETRCGLASEVQREWIQQVKDAGDGHDRPLGVVVTGEFAGIHLGNEVFGQTVLRELWPSGVPRVEIEGVGNLRAGVLARSAATYVARLASQQPTYLDSLPKIMVLLEEGAEPKWKSLLEKDDDSKTGSRLEGNQRYVEGGQRWRRKPDLGGLGVRANAKELKLSVWVEPDAHVREVAFHFADPPTEKVAVTLRAEMEPAGGHARIELIPEVEGALGRREIVLDWSRARRTGQEMSEVEKNYPRKCPGLHRREAWFGAWAGIESVIRRIQAGGETARRGPITPASPLLAQLRQAINARRVGPAPPGQLIGVAGIRIERALDSDGRLHARHGSHQQRFDELIAGIAEGQLQVLERGGHINKDAMAILGYACADGEKVPAVAELIRRVLATLEGHLAPESAIFLGGCIRDAESSTLYMDALFGAMREDWDGFNHALQWAGCLAQWRGQSLRRVSVDTAMKLTFQCQQMIAAAACRQFVRGPAPPPKNGNFDLAFLERHSLVLIAYLLRKRIDDDSYLDPDSKEGRALRKVLVAAYWRLKRGELTAIGGSVQTDVLLKRTIRYIKRRGAGTVVAD